jgi:hypothetical protein
MPRVMMLKSELHLAARAQERREEIHARAEMINR